MMEWRLSAEKQGLRKMQDIVMSETLRKDGKTLIVGRFLHVDGR